MVQATTRTRKQRTEAAIAHALARRWEEAAEENRSLLEDFPDDLEAANRLGKALTELGDVKGAIAAYQRALEIDRANQIARKNLARLEAAPEDTQQGRKPAAAAGEAIRPDRLIDESGKSAVISLQKPNSRALKRLSAGEAVQLEPGEQGVNVKSSTRALLGHLEARAGQRLRRLIEGGNRYEATIRSLSDEGVTIHVREVYRHPSLLDEASFLPRSLAESKRKTPRAYTRASIVKRDAPEGLLGDDDEDDPWSARSSDSDDELGDAGFGEEETDEELEAADEELDDVDDVDDDEDPPEGAEDLDDDDDNLDDDETDDDEEDDEDR